MFQKIETIVYNKIIRNLMVYVRVVFIMVKRIKLKKEKKDEMIKAVKRYFLDERNEEVGDIAASILLDFIMQEMAPEFYNQGVDDAYNLIKDRTEDILSLEIVRK